MDRIDEWKCASGLSRGGDPDAVLPSDLERHQIVACRVIHAAREWLEKLRSKGFCFDGFPNDLESAVDAYDSEFKEEMKIQSRTSRMTNPKSIECPNCEHWDSPPDIQYQVFLCPSCGREYAAEAVLEAMAWTEPPQKQDPLVQRAESIEGEVPVRGAVLASLSHGDALRTEDGRCWRVIQVIVDEAAALRVVVIEACDLVALTKGLFTG